MGLDLGKLVKIFKFVWKVIQLGHEEGLWDKSNTFDPTTEDHTRIVAVLSALEAPKA